MTKFSINYKLVFVFFLLLLNKNILSLDEHLKLIKTLEYNYPIEITFEQNFKNEKLKGWMVINGNGFARTEFEPPNNNLIIANGKWLIFYDPKIDRTTMFLWKKEYYRLFLIQNF